jgi:hypothetical protein
MSSIDPLHRLLPSLDREIYQCYQKGMELLAEHLESENTTEPILHAMNNAQCTSLDLLELLLPEVDHEPSPSDASAVGRPSSKVSVYHWSCIILDC